MNDFLMILFWFLATLAIGWSMLTLAAKPPAPLFLSEKAELFLKEKAELFLLEKFALAYGLGLGLVTIAMAFLSFHRIPFTPQTILFGWTAFIMTAIGFYFSFRKKYFPAPGEKRAQFSRMEKWMVGGMVFQTLYTFFRALLKPLEAYDAIAIYAIKAKIFYLAHTIPADFFVKFREIVPHIEYPLLVPLAETYFYTLIGKFDDAAVKIIFPLYYLALILVFYSVLKRFTRRKTALLFTFFLSTVPQLCDYATNGYADIVLTFYYTLSALYLFLWMKERTALYLGLSGIFAVLAIWTKTEGLMLAVINVCVLSMDMIYKKQWSKAGVVYALFLSGLLICYWVLLNSLGLQVHSDVSLASLSERLQGMGFLRTVSTILYEYQIQFFGAKRWNVVWVIFFVLTIVHFKKLFAADVRILTWTVILLFLGYTSIYFFSTRELSWHLTKTASRFFLHFLPVVTFFSAILFAKEKSDF